MGSNPSHRKSPLGVGVLHFFLNLFPLKVFVELDPGQPPDRQGQDGLSDSL